MSDALRIGIVCPYAWDIPGGVSAHIHDLANMLIGMGHHVSVIAPVDDEDAVLPDFVVSSGKPRAVKYNGSVARLSFGPVVARRVSKWIQDGKFDVIHVHEPLAPSVSVLAIWAAQGPIVATWHASYRRSRMLQHLNKLALTAMEKISGRIAVSEAARQTLVHHVGGDAVVIPNGVDVKAFSHAQPLDGWPGTSLVFLGRVDEPRKGLDILVRAFATLRATHSDLRLLIAGPGDATDILVQLNETDREAVTVLGRIDEDIKASVYASGSIYVAPNTGGESFGIVLLEAMAAGTPVVASDLDAFRRVLDFGVAGLTFTNEDSDSLARVLDGLLRDPDQQQRLRTAGYARAAEFDWAHIAGRIVEVYESVRVPGVVVEPDFANQMLGRVSKYLPGGE